MLGWWIREFRRARQLRVSLVEAGRPIEMELKRDSNTIVITLKTPEPVGRDEVRDPRAVRAHACRTRCIGV